MDIETVLTRRLNRKNPPQYLPAVLRAVASFAINPPQTFKSKDVRERTLLTPDIPHELHIPQVNKELISLHRFGLVERTAEGFPYDRNKFDVVYTRTNPEDWAVAMEVLDILRPLQITEIEQPQQ